MGTFTFNLDNFIYSDLFKSEKLQELTNIFYLFAEKKNNIIFSEFIHYKNSTKSFSNPEVSNIIIEMAKILDEFIAYIFNIENNAKEFFKLIEKENKIFQFKKEFFVRRVLKKISETDAKKINVDKLTQKLNTIISFQNEDLEFEFANFVNEILELDKLAKINLNEEVKTKISNIAKKINVKLYDNQNYFDFLNELLETLETWISANYFQKNILTKNWVSFVIPKKIDLQHLVDYKINNDSCIGDENHYRHRDGFDLTDERYSQRYILNEVEYCIFCHDRDKDTCSKGIMEKNEFKKNDLNYTLKGCPLDQKISESHIVEALGKPIGALSIIMIDNPMCAGTGHRICNDCMKSCIYQKQEPVNIPQIETRILTDVLNLPYGFEIYSLLTRWNPLNISRPFALPYNGKKILVAGMGPAGYTLSHYLLNEGFGVVGIDGLKIEPIFPEYTEKNFKPIKDFDLIKTKLSERIYLGFGGVSEYGITVRWDKNFLTVLYINLLRNENFALYDGIRFGGTITIEDAWEYGFDHIAMATGAGKPTFVELKNNLVRGIRKASDFLMALQLTGAGKKDSLANLQVQLPAIVIGGGLTAIDTATELMAYYPIQVTKIKKRFDELCKTYGEENILKLFDNEEKNILFRYLEHAKEIEIEKNNAKQNGENPNFIPLIRKWGGIKIYYRKNLNDAPAYKLNHEEIIKGFEEGIEFVEKMNPVEAFKDEFGALKEISFEEMILENGKWKNSGKIKSTYVRSLFVAAGTIPNVMYEREHNNTFEMDKWDQYFKSFGFDKNTNSLFENSNSTEFFTSYNKNGKHISFFGDNHPKFAGNVVKAMASAKNGYKKIISLFENINSNASLNEWKNFVETLNHNLKPTVVAVNRLTPTIVEVILHAPQSTKNFQAGQFFRLQNYETNSLKLNNTLLMMEGVALTGAWCDKEKGLISLIVLEMGVSSKICSMLKPNERVVLMGPTGEPTYIDKNSTVILLGGGLGNAVHFSIAKAFKENGGKVIYFAGYKKKEDLFKQDEIEKNTDIVVYSVDVGEKIKTRRKQDKSFVGNIVQAMIEYSKGELGEITIPLNEASRIVSIGSDRMMAAVAVARHTVLKPYLNEDHIGIASINSPMQCMMKAICAQCLQRHIDTKTGKEKFVFTCVNQDQHMDEVDFAHLNSRLKQNSVLEKISTYWFEHVVKENNLARI